MKIAAQVLMLAATAGLALLAANTRKPIDQNQKQDASAPMPAETEAWFI